jgi:hypothetical protein
MFDQSAQPSGKLDLLSIYREMAARHLELAQAACDTDLQRYYAHRVAYWTTRVESLSTRSAPSDVLQTLDEP